MPIGPVIVALDFPNAQRAVDLAKKLDSSQCRVKVGKELFTAEGPKIIEQLQSLGFEIFLDLKFHDIPNTVSQACLMAAKMGVWMINVHAIGGSLMMKQAKEMIQAVKTPPLITAVTLLTSMDQTSLLQLGCHNSVEDQVLLLAELSKSSGMDGVVCSPKEAKRLKEVLGEEFILVTPGVRPLFSGLNDQKRVLPPKDALSMGADYLVIGRAITEADDPLLALERILSDIRR